MLKLKNDIPFLKYRKIYYVVIAAFIIVGIGLGLIRGFNFGIDFTGGTMLQMDMGKVVSSQEIEKVLKANDIKGDVGHAGKENHEIIIKTTKAIDNTGRKELMKDMNETFGTTNDSVLTFELFGPSVGDLLKKNAIIAVIIASLCMLVYIIVRFEWKFGVAAIAGVINDVLVLIAFYGIFSIPINNPFIASILTVVGYSINDTIVVFDRIRENLGLMKKSKMEALIDTSINQTLVRSMMTSITTVVVIIPLFILGGTTIRQFALPLMIGIIAGCGSSIFVCSPIYYELCQAKNKSRYNANAKANSKSNTKSKSKAKA